MDVDTEERTTLDGKFVFREVEKASCTGCHILGMYASGLFAPAPPCSPGIRKDGLSGIWVRP